MDEQEEYKDLTEEETEKVIPIKRNLKTQKEQVIVPEFRYTPYNVEAVSGVVDIETNRLFPDLDSQMAELLNKIDNIEKATG